MAFLKSPTYKQPGQVQEGQPMGGGVGGGFAFPDKNLPDISAKPGPVEGAPLGGGPAGDEGRHGETPRDRMPSAQPMGMDESAPRATAAQPRTPEPRAQMGVLPFRPLPQQGGAVSATPRLRGLYGALGGLQGGGLGLPLDPVSNQVSDPIELLISALKKGGMF